MDTLKEDKEFYASPRHREVLRAAAFQAEEGLAFIREKQDFLPEVRAEFDRKAFFDYFAGVAGWLYGKYHP